MAESISTRCAKLNQIFAGKNVGRKSSGASFTREAMLDAFLLLFEECNSEFMLKDKNISGFVKKCKYFKSSSVFIITRCLKKYAQSSTDFVKKTLEQLVVSFNNKPWE